MLVPWCLVLPAVPYHMIVCHDCAHPKSQKGALRAWFCNWGWGWFYRYHIDTPILMGLGVDYTIHGWFKSIEEPQLQGEGYDALCSNAGRGRGSEAHQQKHPRMKILC